MLFRRLLARLEWPDSGMGIAFQEIRCLRLSGRPRPETKEKKGGIAARRAMAVDFKKLRHLGRETMIGAVIGWIVLGLIAGVIARMLHPGNDAMGMGSTIMLGILGSVVGGAIAYVLRLGTTPYEPGGWVLATIGAILLLAFGWFGSRPRVPAA
jgi:uncharacterized membrane protein YeaQ/YmgE (transglycosylase-associated protein family)